MIFSRYEQKICWVKWRNENFLGDLMMHPHQANISLTFWSHWHKTCKFHCCANGECSLVVRMVVRRGFNQCDKIWQNFATLAIFRVFIYYLEKIIYFWANFHCWLAKHWANNLAIWLHLDHHVATCQSVHSTKPAQGIVHINSNFRFSAVHTSVLFTI